MSIEEKKLRNDIESYLRGEEPAAEELEKAPRLDAWVPAIMRAPGGGYEMTLVGKVTCHPIVTDEKETITSPIFWLDRRGRFARSKNRLWRLGKPADEETSIDGDDE